MRLASLLTTAAGLAVVVAGLGIAAPAHAYTLGGPVVEGPQPGLQLGVAIGASVRLGPKTSAPRVGLQGSVFGEASVVPGDGAGALAGMELGFRAVPGVGVRGEVLGRLGGGALVSDDRVGHVNLLVGRMEGGLAFRRGDGVVAVLGGAVRTPGLRARVLQTLRPLGGEARWFADVGLEVGFVPTGLYMTEVVLRHDGGGDGTGLERLREQ